MKLSKQLRSWYVTIHCVLNIAIEMSLCISKIQSCDECCKMTAETPELHPAAVVTPWHHIGIDFIVPISPVASDGSCYIFTVCGYFTQMDVCYRNPYQNCFIRYAQLLIFVLCVHKTFSLLSNKFHFHLSNFSIKYLEYQWVKICMHTRYYIIFMLCMSF